MLCYAGLLQILLRVRALSEDAGLDAVTRLFPERLEAETSDSDSDRDSSDKKLSLKVEKGKTDPLPGTERETTASDGATNDGGGSSTASQRPPGFVSGRREWAAQRAPLKRGRPPKASESKTLSRLSVRTNSPDVSQESDSREQEEDTSVALSVKSCGKRRSTRTDEHERKSRGRPTSPLGVAGMSSPERAFSSDDDTAAPVIKIRRRESSVRNRDRQVQQEKFGFLETRVWKWSSLIKHRPRRLVRKN